MPAVVEPEPPPEPEPEPESEIGIDPDGDGDIEVPPGIDAGPVMPEPPEYEREPDPQPEPAPAPAARPLAALPVRDSGPRHAPNDEPAGEPAPAGDVMNMQVRQQPLAGARTGPRTGGTPNASYTATDEGEVWFATVRSLVRAEAISALVRELALQSQLVARDGKHWMLRVESASLNQPNSRERLRAALEAAGHADMLSVEVGTVIDSPSRRNAAAAAARQRKAEELVTSDPFVQEMMRDFGAKIVPGSLKVRPLPDNTPA